MLSELSEAKRRKGETQCVSSKKPFGPLGVVLGGFGGHLKPSWGRLVASWIFVGGYLEVRVRGAETS
eukprot:7764752-Pyramimonas_sp.AAC.1